MTSPLHLLNGTSGSFVSSNTASPCPRHPVLNRSRALRPTLTSSCERCWRISSRMHLARVATRCTLSLSLSRYSWVLKRGAAKDRTPLSRNQVPKHWKSIWMKMGHFGKSTCRDDASAGTAHSAILAETLLALLSDWRGVSNGSALRRYLYPHQLSGVLLRMSRCAVIWLESLHTTWRCSHRLYLHS